MQAGALSADWWWLVIVLLDFSASAVGRVLLAAGNLAAEKWHSRHEHGTRSNDWNCQQNSSLKLKGQDSQPGHEFWGVTMILHFRAKGDRGWG